MADEKTEIVENPLPPEHCCDAAFFLSTEPLSWLQQLRNGQDRFEISSQAVMCGECAENVVTVLNCLAKIVGNSFTAPKPVVSA